jgi:hypothetical protein
MRLNLPPQGATDRLREPYQPYLLEFVLSDKKPEEEPVLRMSAPQGQMPLPEQGEQAAETVLKIQYGGNFGPSPSDPGPVCPGSPGGVCPSVLGPGRGGSGRR